MPKLLNREQLVEQIQELISSAQQYIYLICPYIGLDAKSSVILALESANNRGIDINIIYSKGFKKKAGQDQLKKYRRVKLCYIKDLHMKVYLSDKVAIVSSINLYDFSIENNLECGILIQRGDDLWKEVYSMIKNDIYKNMIVEKKREEYTWKQNRAL
jgi:phosphatidylserine/phosphatidylglycerophosphate/cardiolipin synthase-like enzyme